ncbi:MAG: amino acid adenylation domain-containing protein, partial [Pseudonocardiaceae bacterium]
MKDEFRPFHETFLRHAAETPDAVALEFQEQRLTYRELAIRSGRFATYLDGLGVGAETVVGLALERSSELIVAILGILRAGGAWVPLDPSYPAKRLAYMFEDSGVDLLVTDDCGAATLPDTGVRRVDPRVGSRHRADEPPTTMLTRDNLAYVIYTSGSTGRPKGVGLTHGGLTNMAEAQVRTFGVGPGKRILQFIATSFDASVHEIVMALYVGATLVLAPRAAIVPGPGLADLLRRARITHANLPPAVLATLPDTNLPDLEMVVCGGEVLPEALAQRWLVGRRLFNAYGLTETTVWATVAEVRAGSGKPSIGQAIDGVHVVVLDARLEPVPVGEPGELAIGGKGVARGYLGAPGLTAERFIPDRFGPEPGGRLYRTGDLVRVRPDGDLEFLGRIDHQVKLRGFRIELDEIAASLREHPSVQDALVVVRHDGGEDRLVAYATGTDLASAELRAFLADRLPEHLVPSVVVILAALPLLPSGKVDRAALPAPDRASAGLPTEPLAPRTPTEQVLTRLVSDLLGVVEVGVDDDFFHLGGHSLLAGMLAARVRRELGRELPLLGIYQAPTVAAMATLLDSQPNRQELPPLVALLRDEPLPLSFPQERVWFLEQLAPGNLAYNAQATIRLRGPLDPATLQATLTEIVRRHEIFRTRFWAVDGVPVQQPLPPMPIHLPLVDLSDLPEPERDDRAEDVIRRALRDPFDLDRPPLARWLLIRHTEQDHTLVHVEHHFVHDGWSGALFLRELQVIYSAFAQRQPSPLPELPFQFADFAAWQRRWLRDDVLDRYLEFWTKELAGSPQTLDLPTDRPRPTMQSFEGAALRIDLPPVLCRKLREFSRERGVTLYTSMLAGFSTLLHRYTGQTDLLVGCAVANRRLAETEQLIGMVVNTIVLRLDASAQPSFDELLRRVHETTTRAYDWQDMPLDRLVNSLKIARDNSRNPLFQVMFSFHDSPVPDIDFDGLSGTVLERHNGSAKNDLRIVVIPRAEQRVGRISRDDEAPITLIWEYTTDLFDETTMRQMVAHYENLLEAALSQPGLDIGRLPMLTADEQQRLLVDYNNTAQPVVQASLPVLFEAQVRATPEAVAVVFQDTALSYAQLNARANQLAHLLIDRGVGPERFVALALP